MLSDSPLGSSTLYAISESSHPEKLGGRQNPQSPCPGNRLRPVVGTELAVDIAVVNLDCVQGEEKLADDFLIGQPFGDELEHLEFAFA